MNKFLVMALAGTVALASCSNEDSGNNGNNGNGETTYTGLTVTLPASTGTRADDPAAGIAGEKTITEIGVYIIDVNSGRFDYKVLDISTDFEAPTTNVNNQQIYKAKTAVPTVTGTKKVFVVANPGQLATKLEVSGATAMNAIGFGSTKNTFMTVSGSTLTNMVMSGAYTATLGEYDMTTVQSESAALASPISVTISRNLSKAVVQEGQNYSVIGGTTTLTWDLINEAKDAYFLSQSAGTLYRTVPSGAETNNAHAYWSNFSGMTGSNYISVLPYGSGDAKTAAYASSKYMFENNPANMFYGNTTAVRIKGVFVPTTIYGGISGGIPTPAAGFTSGTTFWRSRIDGTYWTATGAAAAAAAGYAGHTTAGITNEFTVYTDGVGYYTIWVNDGTAKGVDRNSYYLMQIKEVRGPGSPEEPVDPTPPVEDDTNLGVEVTVLNWDFKKSIQDIQ